MAHENYDHYNRDMINRLDGFYGKVDREVNIKIKNFVAGANVLDVGCGFGSLTAFLEQSYTATGIDTLSISIEQGKKRYPQSDLRLVQAGKNLPFEDNSFDTIILKDTMHHIYEEGDIRFFLTEVLRVGKKRLIICDPNPTPLLLLARKIIGHKDPVCTPKQAVAELSKAGFNNIVVEYDQFLSFPLSGGYINTCLVPGPLENFFLKFDKIFCSIFKWCAGLYCWRYYIAADIQ